MNPVLTDDEQSAWAQRELRDTFAAAALTGLLSDPTEPTQDGDLDWLVERAYALADAMLIQRAIQRPHPFPPRPLKRRVEKRSKPQPQ